MLLRSMRVILLSLFFLASSSWGAQVGDVIRNAAQVDYTIGGVDKNATTNEVNNTIAQTPATIEFLTIDPSGTDEVLQPTSYEGPNGTTLMPPAVLPDGTVIPTPSTVKVSPTHKYGQQDLVIVRVKDIDQNTHADRNDTIVIKVTNPRTGEVETLYLIETGPNTGVFVGYLQTKPCDTPAPDGSLCVKGGDKIDAVYVDDGTTKHIKTEATISDAEFALVTTKEQSKDVASIGEYVKYTVTVENTGKVLYHNVKMEDQLPDGVKYVDNSFKVDGQTVTPKISADGKNLSYIHPSLPVGGKATLSYVAVIGAGTVNGEAVNTAWASAPGAGKSNVAKTTLKIKEELWRSRGFILGQVYEADAPCEHNETKGVSKSDAVPSSSVVGLDGHPHPKHGCGVEGVKLYMEDGRYVVTDKHGRYHFVDVSSGTHVVQIDEETIKGRYKIEQCERNVRFAGKARSQFVEVHHGGLNRADFCLRRLEGVTGNAMLDIHITPSGSDSVKVTIRTNTTMKLIEPEVFLSLSDGLEYVKGSATSDTEPLIKDNIIDIKMGFRHEVTLRIKATDHIIPDKEIQAVLYYDTRLAKDQHSEVANVTFTTARGKAIIDKLTKTSAKAVADTVGGQTPVGQGDYNWIKPTHQQNMPQYTPEDVDKMGKTPQIVWPPKGWIPDIPSTRVAILYPKGHTVELRLNGHKVSMLNYEGIFRDTKRQMTVMHYKGVDLAEGRNVFVALIKKGSKVVKRLSREVFVESRAPKSITFLPKYSYLMADGKHEPIIAVKMTGPSGHPLRGGMVGPFTTDPKHSPAVMSNGKGQYTVDSEGIAYVRLQPTAIAGEATLTFKLYGDKTQTIRVRLKPYMRKWIVVGFAEGTVGYRTLSGNAEELDRKGAKSGLYVDGRLAFFAKGRIKGDWLMTIAYDSGRKKGDRKLFDSIDPDAYYTIYQDATQQGNEAPSTKKLYIKLEKDAFSAMFGDFSTDIKGGEFDSYSRSYTGFKSEYHGTNVDAVAFIAKTDKLHYREDIRGDGTSGYYHLKHTPIIEGSESITIEVRDRHRPEIIIDSKPLQRWRDYTIDYDTGKIYFKEPIHGTDRSFNPRYIVVRYDVDGDGKSHYTYGGRVSYTADEEKFIVGATAIRQEHGGGTDRLLGVDGKLKINDHTTLTAEFAHTRNTNEGNITTGKAYKVELNYQDDNRSLRAYWRYQDSSFGLGNLAPELTGTRKIGLDATQKISKHWSLAATIYQDRHYDANSSYTDEFVVHPAINYDDNNWSASLGYRYAKNTLTPATNQVTFKLTRYMMDRKLKLSLGHDQSLGDNKDDQYPTRTTLGVDYEVDENLSVYAQLERSDKDGRISWGSTMGASYKAWKGGEIKVGRTFGIVDGSLSAYDTLGILHHWKVGKKWQWGVSYEKGYAEGNSTKESYDAFRAEGKYEGDRFSGDGSIEYRNGTKDDKLNVDLGLYIRKDKDLGLAFGLGWHNSWNATDMHRFVDAKAALAYRPDGGKWIILDRMDYIDRYNKTATDETRTRKLINNFAANYRPDEKWEIGLQYGLKYTLDTIDGKNYGGWTDLIGLDVLYNLSEKWAVGLQGSVLHSYAAGNLDYGWGLYASTTPWENAMLTFGYNIEGFSDEDFSQQNYRHQGPYIQIKIKFDQEDIKNLVEEVAR